jgi:hypothetical protein
LCGFVGDSAGAHEARPYERRDEMVVGAGLVHAALPLPILTPRRILLNPAILSKTPARHPAPSCHPV